MDNSIIWHSIGTSVRGALHKKFEKSNQDSIKIFSDKDNNGLSICAVADGHGDSRCFRSDIGARLAVETSIYICNEYLSIYSCDYLIENFNANKLKETLCRDIYREWIRRIRTHLFENPIENEVVASSKIPTITRPLINNELLPYGTTLLTVIANRMFIIFFQIGDGDILITNFKGSVERIFPKELLGNETLSLCNPESWDLFQTKILKLSESGVIADPCLIMLSTDGYSNAFKIDQDFLKVASDILDMVKLGNNISKKNIDQIENLLPEWLNEASETASGDDISIAILFKIDSFPIFND